MARSALASPQLQMLVSILTEGLKQMGRFTYRPGTPGTGVVIRTAESGLESDVSCTPGHEEAVAKGLNDLNDEVRGSAPDSSGSIPPTMHQKIADGVYISSTATQLTSLLNSLGQRAQSWWPAQSGWPDLTPAVGVVNDVGRLIIRGTEHDIRVTQAACGALRESLDGGEKALIGENGRVFLAGAMWALCEVMTARLDAKQHLGGV